MHGCQVVRDALGEALIDKHLSKVLNEKTAQNHQRYRNSARGQLVQLFEADRNIQRENLFFLLSLSDEDLDRFGRFLCWV